MAGIGVEAVIPLQAPPGVVPLVAPTQAVSPEVVLQMGEAFNRGHAVSMQQGQLDLARQQFAAQRPIIEAQGMIAAEQASPEAVAARRAATLFAGQQAAGAVAARGREALIKLYKEHHGTVKFDARGSEDMDFMARGGADIKNAQDQMKFAMGGLKRNVIPYTGANGQPMQSIENDYHEPYYNPDGTPNKELQKYRKQYFRAQEILSTNPDDDWNTPGNVKESAPGAKAGAASAPVVEPSRPPFVADPNDTAQTGKWLLDAGVVDPAKFMSLSDQNVLDIYKDYVARIAPQAFPAPGTAPVVQSKVEAAKAALPVLDPMGGFPVGPVPGSFSDAKSIVANLDKDPSVETWKNKKLLSKHLDNLQAAYGAFDKKPMSLLNTSNELDLELANTLLQMSSLSATGGTGGRGVMEEMKVKRLEDAAPALERFYGLPDKLLGLDRYEKGTRERLISAGRMRFKSIEDAARPTVAEAVRLFSENSIAPEGVDPELLALATGPSAGAAAPRRTTTVNGKTYWEAPR